jgi:hypothetical protein
MAANITETRPADARMPLAADVATFENFSPCPPAEGMTGNFPERRSKTMQDQQPNHASTPGEIIDYYDTHPDLTLRELATMTGRTVAYLKGLLNHPEKVKA